VKEMETRKSRSELEAGSQERRTKTLEDTILREKKEAVS
jgi:hypothetical protein